MSYQVLARKWRPAVFPDLVGQDSVVRILSNALREKRLHPALIFAGPRGTGKTSTARILAKTLTCPNVKKLLPCNNCKICQDIDSSICMDVTEIDGASHNGVEAVRQIKETVTYLPASPYKIYIIDEVHMLSVSAFNALLKTLEEPPPHAIFIMATTEMRKIPATVLSRCQILQFHRLTDDIIYKQLKKICDKEKAQAEDSALWMLTREAGGSLRDAEGLLDQMITFCGKKFQSREVSEVLGLTPRPLLMQTLQALLTKNPGQVLQILNRFQTTGEDPAVFLQSLIRELRNLLLLKLSPSESAHNALSLSLSDQEKAEFIQWIKPVSSEDLHLLLDMALKGSWELYRVQDTQILLEMLLLKMSQAPWVESLFGGGGGSGEEGTHPPAPALSSLSSSSPSSLPSSSPSSLPSSLPSSSSPVPPAKSSPAPADSTSTADSSHTDDFASADSTPSKDDPNKAIREHRFIKQVQDMFSADILDSKNIEK